MYLDANNLYGWAMSQKLRSGKFRWIPCPEYINLDFSYRSDFRS